MYRLEMETRQWVYPFEADTDDPRAVDATDRSFQVGAREVCWFVPGKLRVVSRSVLRQEGIGVTKAQRSIVRRIVDFSAGVVWTSQGDAPLRRKLLSHEEYERENQARRSRVDFVDLFLRFPRVRSLDHLEFYSGKTGLIESVENSNATAPRTSRVAAEPGVMWEIAVDGDFGLELPSWLADYLIFSVMGVSLEQSREISVSVGELPRKLRATVLPSSSKVVVEYEILSVSEVPAEEALFEIPEAALQRARDLESRFDSAEAVLDALEDPRDLPARLSPLELVPFLEHHFSAEHLERVAKLWKKSEDFEMQVELMRLVLRRAERAARPRVMASVSGVNGQEAIAAAEALIAEDHPAARGAVVRLLERRQVYSDLATGSVVPWAMQHLRLLSGASLEKLAEVLSKAWPADREVKDDSGDDLHEPLGIELDYWLRWIESPDARNGS